MKQIYKVLVYLVLASLLLCTPSAAVAQPDGSAADSQDTFNALTNLLSDLGILSSAGDVSYSDSITRSRFLAMVVNMMGMKNMLPAGGQAPFLDVPAGHTDERHITLAVQTGIAQGKGDGNFGPDDEISLSEAVKILVTALGYKANAEGAGGYPTGYLYTAQTLKLLDGINHAGNLTWEMSINMIYNSFSVDVQTRTGFDDRATFEIIPDRKILAYYQGIYFVDGIINANSLTRLDNGLDVVSGRVEIDGTTYFLEGTNADSLLGYSVQAYYRVDRDNNFRRLVSIYLRPNQNKELLLNADEITGYDHEKRQYTYIRDNENRSSTVLISSLAGLVYNNLMPSGDLIFEPENGSVRLLDNNNDGIYDVVFVEDYYNIIVDYVSIIDEKVYDKLSQTSFSLESGTDREVIIRSSAGADLELNQLVDWNVLSVFEGTRQGKEVVYIKASTSSAEGKVTEMSSTGDITVDGDEYELSRSYESFLRYVSDQPAGTVSHPAMPILSLNDRVEIYLDINGKVAGARRLTNPDGSYAYILKANISSDIDKRLEFKLYNCLTQKMEILSTVDTGLRIDGKRMSNLEEAYAVLKESNQLAMQLVPDGMSQLVYYTMKDEMISTIDTLAYQTYDEGEDTLHLITPPADMLYKTNTKAFSNRMFMDGNTFVLTIPGSAGRPSDNISEARDNQFSKSPATVFANSKKYNVSGYTRALNSAVAELLVTNVGGSTLDNDSYICVIASLTTASTSEEIPSPKLRLMSYNRDITAVLSEPDNINYVLNGENRKYKVGDFVRYSIDDSGEINSIELVFTDNSFVTMLSDGVYEFKEGYETSYGPMGENILMASQTYASVSRVIGKNGSIIETRIINGTDETPSEFHLGTLYTVYIVDVTDLRTPVVKGGHGDVIPESIDPENSVVLIFSQWAEPRAIFILKNSPF